MPAIAARAPNHLGDGVMALPAMTALAQLGPLRIHGPRWAAELYRDVDAEVLPATTPLEGDVAVVFPPSLSAAWRARRCRTRIGSPTDWRQRLLTHCVPIRGHRVDHYNALARAAGARPEGPPRYARRVSDTGPRLPMGHVGLNPLSASGEARGWPAMVDLARAIRGPVVAYGGPGEEAALRRALPGVPVVVGLGLPALGRALDQCGVFISIDTGPAHFARACDVPTVVVHGITDPAHTGPVGSRAIVGPVVGRPPRVQVHVDAVCRLANSVRRG